MSPAVTIGIDLGGTNCRAALVSSQGLVDEIRRIKTPAGTGYDRFLAQLAGLCDQLRQSGRDRQLTVAAVGMGAPGIIAGDGTVRLSPNLPELDGRNPAADLGQVLQLPTLVVNDANAIGWGEALWGAGRPFASFLTLTLGTGVGGGLILERRLWTGADGAAGEVGHLSVRPAGRPCSCGRRGCLEQYASARGLVLGVRERLAAGQASLLAAVDPTRLSSELVARAAAQGDRLALEVFAEAGQALGLILAGVANLLNLEAVVIAGGAAESFEFLLPSLETELRRSALPVPGERLRILRGELGDAAGILGAAGLASA